MGGLKWEALEVAAELLGVDDIEQLVDQLVIIRDHHTR